MRSIWAIALLATSITAHGQAPGEARDIRWEPVIEVARGDAYRGPWRMNDSEFRYVDDA